MRPTQQQRRAVPRVVESFEDDALRRAREQRSVAEKSLRAILSLLPDMQRTFDADVVSAVIEDGGGEDGGGGGGNYNFVIGIPVGRTNSRRISENKCISMPDQSGHSISPVPFLG